MKLSIITVNLNNAAGLKKTIESVVCQSFRDFEYIIVDGGSTDGSVETINTYTGKIAYWESEPDRGIYHAMNKGILRSQGEFCLFLNSGDALYSETVLEKVFHHNYEEAFIIGNVMELYPKKGIKRRRPAHRRAKDNKPMSLFDFYTEVIPHQATFIRRTLFDQYGLYDEQYRIISDWVFFLKTILLEGAKVKYIDTLVTRFDMEGISNVNVKLDLNEREDALRKIIPSYILADYDDFEKINHDFHRMFQHKWSFRLGRFINKLITLWDILTRKHIIQK